MTRRRVLEFDHEDGGKLGGVDVVKHVTSFRRHVHPHLQRPGCYVVGCLMLLAFSTISLFVKFMLFNSYEEMRVMMGQNGGRAANFIVVPHKTMYQSNNALSQGQDDSAPPLKTIPPKLQVRISYHYLLITAISRFCCNLKFSYWFMVVRFQRYGSNQKVKTITNASM